jgi:hypothetical protein
VVHSAGRLLVEVALLVEKTADPSASLGMTKGKSRTLIEVGLLLRKLQIPRLRSG